MKRGPGRPKDPRGLTHKLEGCQITRAMYEDLHAQAQAVGEPVAEVVRRALALLLWGHDERMPEEESA